VVLQRGRWIGCERAGLQAGQLFRRRQFITDLAFSDLAQRRILGGVLLQRFNEWSLPCLSCLTRREMTLIRMLGSSMILSAFFR